MRLANSTSASAHVSFSRYSANGFGSRQNALADRQRLCITVLAVLQGSHPAVTRCLRRPERRPRTERPTAAQSVSLLAYFIDAETAAVDCVNGGRWSADGADVRGARLLARNGLSLCVFAFYEIHEAFASVVLARLQARVS